MSGDEKISRLFAALGAADPHSWAESEIEENLPQLARYRFLRALAQDIQAWDTSSVNSLRDDSDAEGAIESDPTMDLGRLARLVAREAAFNVLRRLADPDSDDLPADIQQQLPGWVLTETTPAGEPTHRALDCLYEDLNTVVDSSGDTQPSKTIAAGWIWLTNLRPFCEYLAAEVEYDFDDSDWLAIDSALPETDDDQPRSAWYAYPLVGRDRIDLQIARSVNGDEVSVSAQGTVNSRVRSRVELLFDIMARYALAPE
ncbi:hypothetical protein ABT121_09710 [Streptomyces sp. NPDC001928]|uniref:hypothetical protein n=1 Tax=Streptomyces sp. NPDC001928 TaxID=3154404 RepID=UPI00332EB98C